MLTEHILTPQILPLGTSGLIVRFALQVSEQATSAVQRFLGVVETAALPGTVQLAGSQASVFVEFDPTVCSRAEMQSAVQALLDQHDWSAQQQSAPLRCWHIPVAFGGDYGPQLQEAAEIASCTTQQAIEDLCNPVRVLTIGFAPGQPFLGLLPERWNMPRQTALTPSVPAGALVVALRQLVLFNNQSTTGWRMVGRCAFRPFQVDRATPFLLKSGDELRFHAVSADDMNGLLKSKDQGLGGAKCEVLS